MLKYILEIRNRIFLVILTVILIVFAVYLYKEMILFLMIYSNNVAFLKNGEQSFYFIFTNVTEIFQVYFELVKFVSYQVFVIYFVYQSFTFLSLAFLKTNFVKLKRLLQLSCFFFIIIFVLLTCWIIPLTWEFFLSFQNLALDQSLKLFFEARLKEYVTFYVYSYYMFIEYFQFFLLLLFALEYTEITKKKVWKFRKIYYYCFVIFFTLISPPDIFSQALISFVFIFLYELFILSFFVKAYLID